MSNLSLRATALCFAWLISSAAPVAAAASPGEAVEAALGRAERSPSAGAGLAALVGALPQLPSLSPAAQRRALGRVAARARHPLVGARAALEALAYEEDRAAASAVAEDLGFLTRWLVLGPDPGEDPATALRALCSGPTPSPGRRVELDGPRTWRRLPPAGPPGAVAFGRFGRSDRAAVVHLVTTVHVPRAVDAVLRLGTSGAVAVVLGDTLIGRARGLAAATPDQLAARVHLPAGQTLLAVAVAPEPGTRPALYLRFTDGRGRPIAGLRAHAAASNWGPLASSEPALLGAALELIALERRGARRFDARLAAAVLRRALGLPDPVGDAGPLLEDLLLTKQAAALPADTLLHALAFVPREEARASVLLQLSASGRDDPLLTLALATLAAERGQPTRARSLLESLAGGASAGLAPLITLTRARLDRLDGLPETGWRTLLPAASRADAAEAWAREAASAATELGRPDVAYPILARLARAAPGRLDHRAAVANNRLAMGAVAEAVAGYRALGRERPDLVGYRVEAARLAGASGDRAAAIAALDAIAGELRWDPDRLEMVGRLLEDLGADAHAAAAYERVLSLRPASDGVRRSLERLGGAAGGPPPFTITYDAARAARAPMDPEAAFESLAEETIVELAADGSATRWTKRLLRVQRVPEERSARTLSVGFDPTLERVHVLAAVVHRGALALPVLARELQNLSERWYGLYYDLRRLDIPFDDLRPGDVVEVAYRVEPITQLFPGVFSALEILQDRLARHELRVAVTAPPSLGLRARLTVPPALRAAGASLTERRSMGEDGRELLEVRGRAIPALRPEPHMPGAVENAASWQLTTFESWAALSTWYSGLLKEQRVVTPAMSAFVARARAAVTTDKGGVADTLLLRRLVGKVTADLRYVGLEFGVHGYKPYRTDQIWARRFGDCKDQASLLVTLLRLAGLEGEVTLLRTRRQGRVPDPLPSLALFDHALVRLPDRGLYLDPTARHFGVGELPAQDQGALALSVGAGGAPLLERTPVDRPEANGVEGSYSVTLRPDGGAGIVGIVSFRGRLAATYRELLADPAARHRNLERLLNGRYPGLSIDSFRLSDPLDRDRPLDLVFDAEVARVAERAGGALQVDRPAGGAGHADRLASLATRRHPLVLGPPSRIVLSFEYILPIGWRAPTLPLSALAQGPFGRYEVRWERRPGAVRVHTTLEIAVDQVAPGDYPAFRAFIQGFDAAVRPPLLARPAAPEASPVPSSVAPQEPAR